MTAFYFICHGQMDISMADKKFYKGFTYNMMTLFVIYFFMCYNAVR